MKTHSFMAALIFPLAVSMFACGGDGSSGAGGGGGAKTGMGCDACKATEACVANLGNGMETERCAPIPETCGTVAKCDDDPCRGALYKLCEMGWTGVGCSDTFAPTIVSCNPE